MAKGKTENGRPKLEEGKEQSASGLLFVSRSGKEKILKLFINKIWEMLSWERFES